MEVLLMQTVKLALKRAVEVLRDILEATMQNRVAREHNTQKWLRQEIERLLQAKTGLVDGVLAETLTEVIWSDIERPGPPQEDSLTIELESIFASTDLPAESAADIIEELIHLAVDAVEYLYPEVLVS